MQASWPRCVETRDPTPADCLGPPPPPSRFHAAGSVSLVPFALRWLQAELPGLAGQPQDAVQPMYSLLGWCQQQREEAEAGGGGCTAMALGTSHAARLSLCAARCLHSAYRLPLPHFLCKVRYPDCLSAPVCCALGRGAPEPGPVARTAPQGGLWAGGEARQVRFALRAARCCSVRGAHSHCCMHKPAAVAPVAADSFVCMWQDERCWAATLLQAAPVPLSSLAAQPAVEGGCRPAGRVVAGKQRARLLAGWDGRARAGLPHAMYPAVEATCAVWVMPTACQPAPPPPHTGGARAAVVGRCGGSAAQL